MMGTASLVQSLSLLPGIQRLTIRHLNVILRPTRCFGIESPIINIFLLVWSRAGGAVGRDCSQGGSAGIGEGAGGGKSTLGFDTSLDFLVGDRFAYDC